MTFLEFRQLSTKANTSVSLFSYENETILVITWIPRLNEREKGEKPWWTTLRVADSAKGVIRSSATFTVSTPQRKEQNKFLRHILQLEVAPESWTTKWDKSGLHVKKNGTGESTQVMLMIHVNIWQIKLCWGQKPPWLLCIYLQRRTMPMTSLAAIVAKLTPQLFHDRIRHIPSKSAQSPIYASP